MSKRNPRATYPCASCNGTFEYAWSDEEAAAELEADFPGFTPSDCEVICDDCHKKMRAAENDFEAAMRRAREQDARMRDEAKTNPIMALLVKRLDEFQERLVNEILYGSSH